MNEHSLQIRILKGIAEQDLARAIFDEVWPSDNETQITSNLLQALVHNGTYVAGAFLEDEIIAAAFAFPGVDEKRHLHLHSHMAAVRAPYRNQNIGTALKMHQKTWALEHGYDTITWTFDPLVRRNARINLIKLGADVFDYFPDFYGDLPDGINAGDHTDRVMAHWLLTSQSRPAIDTTDIPVALSNENGVPVQHGATGTSVLCYLPDDILELRANNPALSLEWRLALRNQLQPRLDSGWHIRGFTADGAYVVTKTEKVK